MKIRPFPLTLHAGLTTVQRYRAAYDRNSLQIAFGFSVYIYFRNFGIFMPPSSALCDLGKLRSRKEVLLPSFLLGTIEKIALTMPKDFHRQRGGKAHVQSQWERENFHPNDIKIPTFFKFQIDVHD